MANHKSAKKRSRQTISKTQVNRAILSKIRTSLNKFIDNITEKKLEPATESLRLYNSTLSKAVKSGLIKKNNASRKLSSLSNKLKKTT